MIVLNNSFQTLLERETTKDNSRKWVKEVVTLTSNVLGRKNHQHIQLVSADKMGEKGKTRRHQSTTAKQEQRKLRHKSNTQKQMSEKSIKEPKDQNI